MKLGDKQRLFSQLVGMLLQRIYETDGYACTFGEAWRTPEMAAIYAERGKGIANSLHTMRLAIDLNLFFRGEYLTQTRQYEWLGEWWENQHDLCRWGGRFSDGNHFSLEHQGVK